MNETGRENHNILGVVDESPLMENTSFRKRYMPRSRLHSFKKTIADTSITYGKRLAEVFPLVFVWLLCSYQPSPCVFFVKMVQLASVCAPY